MGAVCAAGVQKGWLGEASGDLPHVFLLHTGTLRNLNQVCCHFTRPLFVPPKDAIRGNAGKRGLGRAWMFGGSGPSSRQLWEKLRV